MVVLNNRGDGGSDSSSFNLLNRFVVLLSAEEKEATRVGGRNAGTSDVSRDSDRDAD